MIEIIDIGLLATLQGKPYSGNRHLGMPHSGPADLISMAIANKLAHNAYDTVSIEFSMLGGTIKAHESTIIGLAGPIDKAIIIRENDSLTIDHYSSISLHKNDLLIIKSLREGAHIYLSVHGGFDADQYWDGNSTFLPAQIGGHSGRALRSGDRIICKKNAHIDNINHVPERYRLSYGNHHVMRICSENEMFGDFLSQYDWNIGRQGNRIGYELKDLNFREVNKSLDTGYEGLSRAVFAGTIQYPPSGNPFLLGVDAQTTGGYPIIGHIIRADRHIMGQIKSGDSVRFITQKPHEARGVYEKKLNMWREYIPDLHLD